MPLAAEIGVQAALGLGPVATVAHVVAVQELPELAVIGEHEATPAEVVTSTQFVCV